MIEKFHKYMLAIFSQPYYITHKYKGIMVITKFDRPINDILEANKITMDELAEIIKNGKSELIKDKDSDISSRTSRP
jgi:hypothetical protein